MGVILFSTTIPLYKQVRARPGLGSLCTKALPGVTPIESPLSHEVFYHVRKNNSDAFFAKAPMGGTVCSWIGPSAGNWEVDGNWSCGHIPTINNDVEIFIGTVTVNSDAEIHSLIVGAGAGITVASGKTINIVH
jgi:hypothetical protein